MNEYPERMPEPVRGGPHEVRYPDGEIGPLRILLHWSAVFPYDPSGNWPTRQLMLAKVEIELLPPFTQPASQGQGEIVAKLSTNEIRSVAWGHVIETSRLAVLARDHHE